MNKPCLFRVVTNEHDPLLPNWDTLSETDRGILNPRLPVLAFVLFSFGSERLHWKLKARDPCWLWSFHGYIMNIQMLPQLLPQLASFRSELFPHFSWEKTPEKTFQVIHHKGFLLTIYLTLCWQNKLLNRHFPPSSSASGDDVGQLQEAADR